MIRKDTGGLLNALLYSTKKDALNIQTRFKAFHHSDGLLQSAALLWKHNRYLKNFAHCSKVSINIFYS